MMSLSQKIPTNLFPPDNCFGCFACLNICGKNAISMHENYEGFLYPQIDSELCTDCRKCEIVCPALNNIQNPNNAVEKPDAFAAIHCDDQIRKDSSSGGIFSALASTVLTDSGVVFGVSLEKDLSLRHIAIKTIEALPKLQGSKYFQAAVGSAYQQVKQELHFKRQVLFSGTPCQIAGLYGFLGGQRSDPNLITIDLICHGVPSPKVFRKYIQECENNRYGKTIDVSFRDKRSGWKSYSVTTVMEYNLEEAANGSKNNRKRYSKTLHQDLFMRAFLQNICLRPSCHSCDYARFPRIADITLADYWGVSHIHPEMDDNKGTSLVLLNSERGRSLWNNSLHNVKAVVTDLDIAVRYNPGAYRSQPPHKDRQLFFQNLDSEPFNKIVQKYCKKMSLNKRILRKFKLILFNK